MFFKTSVFKNCLYLFHIIHFLALLVKVFYIISNCNSVLKIITLPDRLQESKLCNLIFKRLNSSLKLQKSIISVYKFIIIFGKFMNKENEGQLIFLISDILSFLFSNSYYHYCNLTGYFLIHLCLS